jgi:hypothetical protein
VCVCLRACSPLCSRFHLHPCVSTSCD